MFIMYAIQCMLFCTYRYHDFAERRRWPNNIMLLVAHNYCKCKFRIWVLKRSAADCVRGMAILRDIENS